MQRRAEMPGVAVPVRGIRSGKSEKVSGKVVPGATRLPPKRTEGAKSPFEVARGVIQNVGGEVAKKRQEDLETLGDVLGRLEAGQKELLAGYQGLLKGQEDLLVRTKALEAGSGRGEGGVSGDALEDLARGQKQLLESHEGLLKKTALLDELMSGHRRLQEAQTVLVERTAALEEQGKVVPGPVNELAAGQERLLAGHADLLKKAELLDELLAGHGRLMESQEDVLQRTA
ncbi:MAG: hypothetical protein AAGC74_11400, partial [Verrucomicrobiota bacterium]